MRTAPAILARGPWAPDQVETRWSDEHYAPPPERGEAADAAIAALRDRGSPSHDGLAARLVRHEETDGRLLLDLQPVRWALRLVEGDASCSVAAMCLTRDSEGRWLAGRRATWLASWAGRWALGAGGAVDVGESPVDTLTRELREEWSVEPDRLRVEALVRLPHDLVMFVGQAWLAPGTEVTPDHEHDAHAWWPRDVADWPEEAHADLREIPVLLGEALARVTHDTRVLDAVRRPSRVPSLRFDTLKRLSFAHSTVYAILLVVWLVPGLHTFEFVFGLAHGLGWIAMCALSLAAVRARVIPLRLGFAVAVIGAVGPFVGSYEFVREQRRRDAQAPRPRPRSAEPVQRCPGSKSSTQLPAGSSTRIWRPPTPSTISLRNVAPAPRRRSTSASRSATSSWKRFQPPGSGRRPSGIAAPPPGPPPGALSSSRRSPRSSIANGGAGCITTSNPSRSR